MHSLSMPRELWRQLIAERWSLKSRFDLRVYMRLSSRDSAHSMPILTPLLHALCLTATSQHESNPWIFNKHCRMGKFQSAACSALASSLHFQHSLHLSLLKVRPTVPSKYLSLPTKHLPKLSAQPPMPSSDINIDTGARSSCSTAEHPNSGCVDITTGEPAASPTY